MITKLNSTNVDSITPAIGTRNGNIFTLSQAFLLSQIKGLEVERDSQGKVCSAKYTDGETCSVEDAQYIIDHLDMDFRVDLTTGELITKSIFAYKVSHAINAAVERHDGVSEVVLATYADDVDGRQMEIVEKTGVLYKREVGGALAGPICLESMPRDNWTISRENVLNLKEEKELWGKFLLPSQLFEQYARREMGPAETAAWMQALAAEFKEADARAIERIRAYGFKVLAEHWNDYHTRYTKYFPEKTEESHLADFCGAFAPNYYLTEQEVRDALKK